MNCKINNVSIEICNKNLVGTNCDKWNCILVGDMFYDAEFGYKMFSWLKDVSNMNKLVLVGDTGRQAFKETCIKNNLNCVVSYPLSKNTIMENNGFQTASVWKFIKSS